MLCRFAKRCLIHIGIQPEWAYPTIIVTFIHPQSAIRMTARVKRLINDTT
jgi:hypothetical protein